MDMMNYYLPIIVYMVPKQNYHVLVAPPLPPPPHCTNVTEPATRDVPNTVYIMRKEVTVIKEISQAG